MRKAGHKLSDLEIIRFTFNRQVLNLRAIKRVLDSSEFEIAYKESSEYSRTLLEEILKKQSVPDLKNWVQYNQTPDYNELSYRQLREIARNNHIFRWSRLSREELLEKLSERSLLSSPVPSEQSSSLPVESGDA